MINARDYEELLERIIEHYSGNLLKVKKTQPPQNSPAVCLRNKLSYFGYALLDYKNQPLTLQFLYPTERGTFISNGNEMSPSFQAINISKQKEDSKQKYSANSKLSQFIIYPAALIFLKKRLETIFLRKSSGKTTDFETDYLEGLLNQTTFRKLSMFDDINLLAEKASRRKIAFEGGENMPASARFLDDTHRKKLCPLETPESTEIGLRLFVARNADLKIEKESSKKKEVGLIISESTTEDIFGYSSWIVPFLQHNDGARAMMGGKNFKQAIPLLESEIPLIKTGIERELAETSGRLIKALAEGIVKEVTVQKIVTKNGETEIEYALLEEYPSNSETPLKHNSCVNEGDEIKVGDLIADWSGTIDGEAALGRNLLVGYLPFRGYNIEDGIVVSRSLAEKFSSQHLYEFQIELNSENEILENCVNEGETVSYRDILMSKIDYSIRNKTRGVTDDNRKTEIEFNKRCSGKVVKVEKTDSEVIVQIESIRPLEIGDKITGRHGNKGVVTLISEDEEMPYFYLNGHKHHLEVLLSPMGVVSRMNLGQLLETHYSWLVKNKKIDPLVGEPFSQNLDFDFLEKQLKEIGLESGKAELFLDEVNSVKTVVGWQYFAKLNHLAGDKFHVRTSGKKYSALTGQPVKGKRLGGGQRIGEMEVWSLLGHSAFNILHEFLTVKSDDTAARESLTAKFNSEPKLPSDFKAIFPQTLNALQLYLRGLGIELEFLQAENEKAETINAIKEIRLRLADENTIKSWTHGKLPDEFVRESLIESNQSHFEFLRSKFSPKFQEQLTNIFIARQANPLEQILIETKTFLSLKSVENEIDKLIGNELQSAVKRFWGINGQGILFDETLTQRFKKLKKIEISDELEKLLAKHSKFIEAIEELKSRETEQLKKETGKVSKKVTLKSTAKIKKILSSHLTDAEQEELNRSLLNEVFLKKGQIIVEISDLEDAEFFGETRDEQRSWMGCIQLAEQMPHPLFAPKEIQDLRYEQFQKLKKDKKDGKKDKHEKLPPATIADYQSWRELIENWAKKSPDKMISVLPVIPITLRPAVSEEFQHALTKLYRDVVIANRMLARSPAADKPRRMFALFKAIERLFRGGKDDTPSLLKILEGKFGLLRRHLLGKRQDFSGRAVIVPDPTLRLDECGLPFEMLLKWLKPLVKNHLIEQRRLSAEEAQETIRWAMRKNSVAVDTVSDSLKLIIEDQKLLVIINRQPSLHRYSLLSFKPKIRTDYVIGLPPMMCNGFNADFDGDTVAVHFPITQISQKEAQNLLPTNHLFTVANGNLILSLGQDYALGAFSIKGKKSFNELTKASFRNITDSNEIIEILKIFQDETFEAAACGESSFSLFDIREIILTETEKNQLFEQFKKENGGFENKSAETAERLNQHIEDAAWKKLAKNPDNSFARYFLSKARGNKAQLRQIAGGIGFVFDGEGNPLGPLKNSFFQGLSKDEYWQLSHSTRRTMIDKKLSVGEAGALTRDLVEGAYELKIISEDCKTKSGITVTIADCNLKGRVRIFGENQEIINDETNFPVVIRSPLTCQEKDGICQKCYGINPATQMPDKIEPTENNYPEIGSMIGVIAGQSIGERGTQLSMRTFHSGGKSMSLKDVKSIFCYGKIDIENEDADLSIESRWFNKVGRDLIINREAYDNAILPVHFEVILRAMKDGENLIGCQKRATEWNRRNFLAAASYRELRRILREVFESENNTDELISPKSKVVLGGEKI